MYRPNTFSDQQLFQAVEDNLTIKPPVEKKSGSSWLVLLTIAAALFN